MMEMMTNPIKLTRVKKIARAARMAMEMFLYSAYVPHLDHKSLINVPEGNLSFMEPTLQRGSI
jgi:predicted Zn-dependent protease